VALALGCAPASTPFMPLAVGNAWSYRMTADGDAFDFTLSISSRDENGFRMVEPDGRAAWWRVEDGFLVLDRGAEVIPFFHVPPRLKVSWDITGEDGRTYYVKVRGYEAASVPAGSFRRCLRVELEDEARTKLAVFHFAPGAGMVRREETTASGRMLIELAATHISR